jgi:cytochrome c oxidase subunit 2
VARRVLPLLPFVLLLSLTVACDTPQSTAVIAGSHNEELWHPYKIIFWLAGIVFVAIMVITLVLSIMYRERPGRTAVQIHGNTRLEVVWTLIPVALVVIMAVPTVSAIRAEAQPDPPGTMQVIATGHQWWFEFEYPDLGVKTANELHIPVNKPVHFQVRSADVIHAFWVPQLAGKIDMMPGHVNSISFTGLIARPEPYLGQCAELCGLSHANMRFRVFVDTQSDFDAWVSNQKSPGASSSDTLAAQGKEIFNRSACIGCHTVTGTNAVGIVGPNLTHVGQRHTIAAGTLENTPDNLLRWIRNSSEIKPGSKMPPMSKDFGGALSDDEIRAVAAYLQSLK